MASFHFEGTKAHRINHHLATINERRVICMSLHVVDVQHVCYERGRVPSNLDFPSSTCETAETTLTKCPPAEFLPRRTHFSEPCENHIRNHIH